MSECANTDILGQPGQYDDVVGHATSDGRIFKQGSGPADPGLGRLDETGAVLRFGRDGAGETEVGIVVDLKAFGLEADGVRPEWGLVNEEGHVVLLGATAEQNRAIGQVRGPNAAAALAFFMLRFEDLVDEVRELEGRVHAASPKQPLMAEVHACTTFMRRANALGDFDRLLQPLKALEHAAHDELKANAAAKVELCVEAEAIAESDDWPHGPDGLRDIMERWKLVGPVSREDGDHLWSRLQAARDRYYARRREHHDELERGREASLERKTALCSEAEALSLSDEWKAAWDRLQAIIDEWKQAGPAPREPEQALWERLHAARKTFNHRRQAHFAEQDRARRANLEVKKELCVRAEEIAQSTDWKVTTEAMGALLEEWKAAGPGPRDQEAAVWERFQAARTGFYERRRTHFAEQDRERRAHRDAKAALCAEAEALVREPDFGAARERVRELQAQWKTIGEVPRAESDALWQRFRAAIDAVFAAADAERVSRVETNIRRWEEQIEKQEQFIETMRDGIAQDEYRRDRARNDEFSAIVTGWIIERTSKISEAEGRIRELKDRIKDIRARLRG